MSMYETVMHILYSKQNGGNIKLDKNMKTDYSGIINDLINMRLVTKIDSDNLKFTELGNQKINYLREVRGLTK